MTRYAKKLDATHTPIKEFLEFHGVEVVDCASAGKVPDLLVKYNSFVGWIECKVPVKREVRFTYEQVNWIAHTRFSVRIVDNKFDALEFAKTHNGRITQSEKDNLAIFCSMVTDKKKLFTVDQVQRAMQGER